MANRVSCIYSVPRTIRSPPGYVVNTFDESPKEHSMVTVKVPSGAALRCLGSPASHCRRRASWFEKTRLLGIIASTAVRSFQTPAEAAPGEAAHVLPPRQIAAHIRYAAEFASRWRNRRLRCFVRASQRNHSKRGLLFASGPRLGSVRCPPRFVCWSTVQSC